MSETPTPPAPPPAPPPANSEGSLGLGIAIAWACLIGGYVIVGAVASSLVMASRQLLDNEFANLLAIVSVLLPWVAMIGLIVYFASIGRIRTAKGVALGIASIIGVLILLIAACFGLLSSTNFH
jgi:hypothetical protein